MARPRREILSPEDIETLALVREHHSSKRVAAAWCRLYPDKPITHHAVKARVAKAMRIFDVSDRREAVRRAFETVPAPIDYPQGLYPLSPLPLAPADLLHEPIDDDGRFDAASPELRDGNRFEFEPLPDLPDRRWFELFRKRGARFNDLTVLQTVLNIALATALLATAAYLVMRGMATWR